MFDKRFVALLFVYFEAYNPFHDDDFSSQVALMDEAARAVFNLTIEDQHVERFRSHLVCRRRFFKFLKLLLKTLPTSSIPHSIWKFDRCDKLWIAIKYRFSDIQWKSTFRLSRGTFQHFCNLLKETLEKKTTHFREAVTLEKRIVLTLWRLGTKIEFRGLAEIFGIGKSTAVNIFHDTCKSILRCLGRKVIRLPTGNDLRETVEYFAQRNFPQCVGAIDGTHIPILAPKVFPADFYCVRKGGYTVIMQAVVDSSLKFINVNIGWPGSVHDARVLVNSNLYKFAEQNRLFPPETRDVAGVQVPYYLLGDAAYPLLHWLMKPFPTTAITPEKERFNRELSSKRMLVERAFGKLKSRWRCLLKRNDTQVIRINIVIHACCILHNICEDQRDSIDDSWNCVFEEDVEVQEDEPRAVADFANPELIRNALLENLR